MHEGAGEHRRRRVRRGRSARPVPARSANLDADASESATPDTSAWCEATEKPDGVRKPEGAAKPTEPARPHEPAKSGEAPKPNTTARRGFARMARPSRGPIPGDLSAGERSANVDREPHDSHAAGAIDDHERGLRGLIGGGSSQVSVTAAMRARDAARPTEADIAAAELNLTIVHRGWVPRDH